MNWGPWVPRAWDMVVLCGHLPTSVTSPFIALERNAAAIEAAYLTVTWVHTLCNLNSGTAHPPPACLALGIVVRIPKSEWVASITAARVILRCELTLL